LNRRLKAAAFIGTLGGFALSAAAYDLGFERWPPRAMLVDGTSAALDAADLRRCFKAKTLSVLGDQAGAGYWQTCRDHLAAYRALDGFAFRSVLVAAVSAAGLLSLFGFALCIRLEQPPLRVIRGPQLHSGHRGKKAFAKACALECRAHGHGIALFPPNELGRDRETRHFLILGSVGGGKTQTMLHMILAALARKDSVLVLDTKGDMMAGLPGMPCPLCAPPIRARPV